jgi:hypothetical protein
MSFRVVFGSKKRAVRTGCSVNIDGGHAKGFKTHCPASVGMAWVVGDIEVFTGKAVDERSCMVFSVGHDENPANYHLARRLHNHIKTTILSFPRRRESSYFKAFWMPACAGMTNKSSFSIIL